MTRKRSPSASRTSTARRQLAVPTLDGILGFMRLLWEVDHALQAVSQRMGRELGVTGPQRLVVRIVGRFPGLSAGQLADVLRLHPSTVTGLVKRLERRRLVRKRGDPDDGRRVLVGLTARGRALDTARPGTVESALARALSRLAPGKVFAAGDVLTAIAATLMAAATARHRGPS